MRTHPYKDIIYFCQSNANITLKENFGEHNRQLIRFSPRQLELLQKQKVFKVICWSDIHCIACGHY